MLLKQLCDVLPALWSPTGSMVFLVEASVDQSVAAASQLACHHDEAGPESLASVAEPAADAVQ